MTDDGGAPDVLLDAAPCGFVSFADDGTVRVANATLLELLGYARADVVGRHVETILTVGSRIFYQTHFFPVLSLHGRADEIFLLLRRKDGVQLSVLANAVRRERDGAWITDCVLMPVHERRKFEDALVRAKKEAEEARALAQAHLVELEDANAQLDMLRMAAEDANRAKSAFLAMMSHELRTPLNAIIGYVQLLEMGLLGPVTDAQVGALGSIARSQSHLLRLINEVLNLARIESGHVDFALDRLELATVVDAVRPMMETQFERRGIRWEVDVHPGLAAMADREKVEQIVLNLLSNASKFTSRGGTVAVTANMDSSGGEWVVLHVRDTGAGIPPEWIDRVFEPFAQVDNRGSQRGEGTGLGLAISRDLARGMGGDLSATSEVNVGSVFSLTLPRARDDDAAG